MNVFILVLRYYIYFEMLIYYIYFNASRVIRRKGLF